MTLLQISEKIRDHLIKQNAQSDDKGQCQYRSSDGGMCAVGCLIVDDAYSTELEMKTALHYLVQDAVSRSLKFVPDSSTQRFLKLWQTYHDSYMADGTFVANYTRWIHEGSKPDAENSPSAVHEYLKGLKEYDMTGEITKRHIAQVSRYIANHLLKQGKQATSNGKCQYRAEDGCMCAVGVLIDPEHYDVTFEGVSLSASDVRTAVASSLGIDEALIDYGTPMHKMMRSWQRYHDYNNSTFSNEEIEYKFKEISLMLDNKTEFPNLKD